MASLSASDLLASEMSKLSADFVYHLTTRNAAAEIKKEGLVSSFIKNGRAVARPNGAFAKDKEAQEPVRRITVLSGYLLPLLARGCSLEQIMAVPGMYKPRNYEPVGDRSVDPQELSKFEDEYKTLYYSNIPCYKNPEKSDVKKALMKKPLPPQVSSSSLPSPSSSSSSSSSSSAAPGPKIYGTLGGKPTKFPPAPMHYEAEKLISQCPDHFLCKLAIEAVRIYYRTEEIITSKNVYFMKSQDALSGYKDYRVHLAATDIVMLRIRGVFIKDPKQDEGEGRGITTVHPVSPMWLQYIKDSSKFEDAGYRDKHTNWELLPLMRP